MKQICIFCLSAVVLIGLSSCGEKDDPFLLLPFGSDSAQMNTQTPADVPQEDLKPVTDPGVSGGGEVVAVVGKSATPSDEDSGDDDHGKAGDDHGKAGDDHGKAGDDHGKAGDDHGKAGDDHGKAGDDHGKAGDDHGKAGDDHGKAGDDHGKAGDDHGKAGDDHGKAGDDHGKAGDDHGKAGDDHGKAGDDHGKAGDDHGKAGDDHGKAGDDHGKKSLVRLGKDSCYLEGKWYKDASSIFTYQQDKTAGFCFKDVPAGLYEVRVMARHWVKHDKKGAVPEGFRAYQLMVAGDGVAGTMQIPASSTGWESGTTTLDLTGGDIQVNLSWSNAYCKGKDCVNMALHQVKLQRTGDSSRSAIAAYIMSFSTRSYVLMMALFVLALAGIIGINRLKKSQQST